MHKGFMGLHEMETFDMGTHENYREVGLGFYNGPKAGNINARWEVWQPNIGFVSMMKFVHYSVSLFVPFSSAQHGEGDF